MRFMRRPFSKTSEPEVDYATSSGDFNGPRMARRQRDWQRRFRRMGLPTSLALPPLPEDKNHRRVSAARRSCVFFCASEVFVHAFRRPEGGRNRTAQGNQRFSWMLSAAPKGPKQNSPGQSVAPPWGWRHRETSPERATQTDASIVPPFQGLLSTTDSIPRATATLAQLASPCPGLVCSAPTGQKHAELSNG